jgi:hypothetical protein
MQDEQSRGPASPPFMRARRALDLVLACAVATGATGCTSRGVAPLQSPGAQLVAEGGTIVLRDEKGSTLPIDPASTIRFRAMDGGETERFEAARLCRTTGGFLLRASSGSSCVEATPLIAFDDIASVEVENADRAAVTAIVTGVVVVVVVVVAIVVIEATKDDKKSGSSSSSSSNASSGTSSSSSSSSRSSPGGPGRHVASSKLFGPAVRQAARLVTDGITTEIAEQSEPVTLEPGSSVFSETSIRRSTIRGLASVDFGVSAFSSRQGATSSGRGGVRLFDFLDLTVGARMFEGGTVAERPRGVPTFGLGLHGRFPRARWLALALGGEIGTGSALDMYATGTVGLRFAPLSTLWVGLYPLHPAYAAWSEGRSASWTALSSADVAFAF